MKRVPVSVLVLAALSCTLAIRSKASEGDAPMKMIVRAVSGTTVFELNDSRAARDLYAQLPLSVTVEDYSTNEKIFYPPKKLSTADTPLAEAGAGTLAYYAPWGDVVMFYAGFSPAAGLYALGHATSGREHLRGMSGTIRLERSTVP